MTSISDSRISGLILKVELHEQSTNDSDFEILALMCNLINSYKPSVLFVGHMQTVQTLIRRQMIFGNYPFKHMIFVKLSFVG